MIEHMWPANGEHLFGPWFAQTASSHNHKATQFRSCVHPYCNEFEVRETPKS